MLAYSNLLKILRAEETTKLKKMTNELMLVNFKFPTDNNKIARKNLSIKKDILNAKQKIKF
jgi:hypothetical protein